MPEDIAIARELLETATSNVAMAEDAEAEAAAAADLAESAHERSRQQLLEAQEAEQRARRAYIDALRARGWHHTATGPAPDQTPGQAAGLWPNAPAGPQYHDHGPGNFCGPQCSIEAIRQAQL